MLGLFLWFLRTSSNTRNNSWCSLAAVIPHMKKRNDFFIVNKNSNMQLGLHVAYFIMLLFALQMVQVFLEGLSFNSLLQPVPLGILLGLFVGKQLVYLYFYASIKLGLAKLPNNSNWISFYAVSVLTGIGFTMSSFVGNLASVNNMEYMDGVKIGVLSGSLLSTIVDIYCYLSPQKKLDAHKRSKLLLLVILRYFFQKILMEIMTKSFMIIL